MRDLPRFQLSHNFWLDEFTRSGTDRRLGIDNSPDEADLIRLKERCRHILQPVRDQFGPVTVLSGFRCAMRRWARTVFPPTCSA